MDWPRRFLRPQRLGPWPEAEFRPDISSGDDPPRDEAECDGHEKPDHLLWHQESLSGPAVAVELIDAAAANENAKTAALVGSQDIIAIAA